MSLFLSALRFVRILTFIVTELWFCLYDATKDRISKRFAARKAPETSFQQSLSDL